MTDSGQGPLVGLPVSLGVAIMGFNVAAMRLPVALLAATAAPLLWLVGRRTIGEGAATLAALLLAISPAFLLYARTATLVGASLVPLLLTALALARVLDAEPGEGWRWRREGALAGSLLLGIYAYAPVRLLWPLALVLLGIAAWRDPLRRAVLLRTLVLCMVIVPAALMALARLTTADQDAVTAAVGYFHARGEQLVAMRDDPAAAGLYLRDASSSEDDGWQAALRLVGQNRADLARLLLDRDTAPVATDYWNERWPLLALVPAAFGLIGAVAALRWGRAAGALSRCCPHARRRAGAAPAAHLARAHRAYPAGASLRAAPRRGGSWLVAGWLAGLSDAERQAARSSAMGRARAGGGDPAADRRRGARGDEMPLGPPRESAIAAALAAHPRRRANGAGRCWSRIRRSATTSSASTPPPTGSNSTGISLRRSRSDPVKTGVDARPALLWRGALGALRDGRSRGHAADSGSWPRRSWTTSSPPGSSGCSGFPDSVILP